MCGIFAYMGHQPVPIVRAIQVLRKLETEQEPGELTPVGGHGAGIAYLNSRNEFTLVKVGKTGHSPAHDLKQQLPNLTTTQSSVVLGHVRRASPEFRDTIQHSKCTQPYKPHCTQPSPHLVSAHNGYLENYKQLRSQLHTRHRFESEPIKLIDSEIIPHLYEEQLTKTGNPTKASHELYEQAEGRNTIVTLHTNTDKHQTYLNVIHKGKTRGLTIWTRSDDAVLLCSREKPILSTLNKTLKESNCQRIAKITRNDALNLEAHFSLDLKTLTEEREKSRG